MITLRKEPPKAPRGINPAQRSNRFSDCQKPSTLLKVLDVPFCFPEGVSKPVYDSFDSFAGLPTGQLMTVLTVLTHLGLPESLF